MASLPPLSAAAASLLRHHICFRHPTSSRSCFAESENHGCCGGVPDAGRYARLRLRLRWRSPVRAKVGEVEKDKGADLGLRTDQPKSLRRRLRLRPRLRVLRWRLLRLLSPRELAGDAAAALRRAIRRVPPPAVASIVLGALLLAARLTLPKNPAQEVAYSDLLAGLRAGAVTAVAFEEDSRRIYFRKAEDVGSGDDERETGRGAAAAKWPYYARRVPHDEGFLLGLMRERVVGYRSTPRPGREAGKPQVNMLTTLLTLWFLTGLAHWAPPLVVVDGGGRVAWDATTTSVLPLLVELCKSLLVHRCCAQLSYLLPTGSPGNVVWFNNTVISDHLNGHQNCWLVLRLSWSELCSFWHGPENILGIQFEVEPTIQAS